MLEQAKNLLKKYVTKGKKITLAVSGGSDSMSLAHLVLECDFIDKNNVTIFNVNHNIRGETSDRDSNFVERFCVENSVNYKGVCAHVLDRCALSRRSVECEAREARLELFVDLIKSGATDMVLTAHHALDNAETILMHVFRGCGINGLLGMEILSKNGIFRPLLSTSKAEIDEYILANKIEYMTDETNADTMYDRNFIRREILPKIESRYGGVTKNLLSLSEAARESERALDAVMNESFFDLSSAESGVARLSVLAFGESEQTSRYVFRALKAIGVQSDFYSKHMELVRELSGLANGARQNLGTVTAIKEYDYITFTREDFAEKRNESAKIHMGKNIICDKTVVMEKASESDFALAKSGKANFLVGDGKKLDGKDLRFRKNGDMFCPYGGGTKKLKEYLIDKKIPLRLRDSLAVVASENNILAVVGVQISQLAKVENFADAVKIYIEENIEC